MSIIDKIGTSKKKEEFNPSAKYPIIWKIETCLVGECRGERPSHRWSMPFSTPEGLVAECYDCHKTKRIYVEHDPTTFKAQPVSNFVLRRLAELKED